MTIVPVLGSRLDPGGLPGHPPSPRGRRTEVQEQTMVLQVLMATMAYFLCGILRKERDEKRKKKMSWPRKKNSSLSLISFLSSFSHANKASLPHPPFILALPVEDRKGGQQPLLEGDSQGQTEEPQCSHQT